MRRQVILPNSIKEIENRCQKRNQYKKNSRNNVKHFEDEQLIFLLDNSISRENDNISDIIISRYSDINIKFEYIDYTIKITSNKSYQLFDKYTEQVNEIEGIQDAFRDKGFLFVYKTFDESNSINFFDEQLFHNYYLIMKKFYGQCRFYLNILHSKSEKSMQANKFRVMSFFGALDENDKSNILFNNESVLFINHRYGRIIPSFYVDEEMLKFLSSPVDELTWKRMIDVDGDELRKIKNKTIKDKLLSACQYYLFRSDLRTAQSKEFLELKKEMYLLPSMYENHVSKMPFLALIIFAQYDFFYRSDLLQKYKEKLKKKSVLKRVDFCLELQKKQERDKYIAYLSLKREGFDIKTLVRTDKDGCVIAEHEQIVSEMIESVTIAEGLLQLLDNSVKYAGGGVISFRIRNYTKKSAQDSDDSLEYFRNKYNNFFDVDGKKESSCGFFLEVKISDRLRDEMGQVFLNNIKKRIEEMDHSIDKKEIKKAEELRKWLQKNENEFLKINPYKFFLGDNDIFRKQLSEYYSIGNNRISHFGLEIFKSIIKSKGGLIQVSGHGKKLDDDLPFEEDDSKGMVYQLVLPIGNKKTIKRNVIIDTDYDMKIDIKKIIKYKEKGEIRIYQPDWEKINSILLSYTDDKACCIEKISEIFFELDSFSRGFMVVDMKELEHRSYFFVEVLIKGLMCYLVDSENELGVYIKTHCSHDFIEVIRLFSLFYDREGKSDDKMSNIQIYLSGEETGEEAFFIGSNLNINADRLNRMVMSRGLMTEYQFITMNLLKRYEE